MAYNFSIFFFCSSEGGGGTYDAASIIACLTKSMQSNIQAFQTAINIKNNGQITRSPERILQGLCKNHAETKDSVPAVSPAHLQCYP